MSGKVALHIYEDNLGGQTYQGILKNVLVPSARAQYPNGFILQRDNSKVHRARVVGEYLETKDADIIEEELPWPSYSPDLNPIENLWGVLKNNIRKRQPHTTEDLRNIIEEEWEALDDNYVKNLCLSIHNRIDMCIENEGARINYYYYYY